MQDPAQPRTGKDMKQGPTPEPPGHLIEEEVLHDDLMVLFGCFDLFSPSEQQECLDELRKLAIVAMESDDSSSLTTGIHAWAATAEILSEPELAAELRRPLETVGTEIVPRPLAHELPEEQPTG